MAVKREAAWTGNGIGRFSRTAVREQVLDRPALVFWFSFALLNLLLFLPLMLLNWPELWPVAAASDATGDFSRRWFRGLIERDSFDPFRLNLELLLLVTVWATVSWLRRPAFRLVLVVVYFAALSYAIYEGITLSLWQAEPVFYTHYFLALDGLRFLLDHLHLSPLTYIGAAAAVLAASALIYALLRVMAEAAGSPWLGRATRITLVLLTVLAVGLAVTARATLASPSMAISSLTAKLERNIDRSLQVYANVHSSDEALIRAAYDYTDHPLAETPDVYLIFVESYGSVLYKRDDYRVAYEALLDELETSLADGGLFAASTLSEAPTWGGGSWMSYTSALFGLRVEEHPAYLALVDRYQERDYPDLGRYLKAQGYHYARISSLSVQLKDEAWQRYSNFFGVDEWLRYRDLDFVGQRYGWGPAPPDQYVLNYALQAVEAENDEPLLLFYITQNSHYPWIPLPSLAEDWQALNVPEPDQEATPDDELPHAKRRQNYFDAVEYELRFLTEFMLEHAEEDAIFVLIGDHQPPRVSKKVDGWDAPMHIISSDADFVESFAHYGFVPGLGVDTIAPTMRHEGFYSMFARELVANYGADPANLPAYLPDGVVKLTAGEQDE